MTYLVRAEGRIKPAEWNIAWKWKAGQQAMMHTQQGSVFAHALKPCKSTSTMPPAPISPMYINDFTDHMFQNDFPTTFTKLYIITSYNMHRQICYDFICLALRARWNVQDLSG